MNCVDSLKHEDFRWLVCHLRNHETTVKSPQDVPRDVIADRNIFEAYLKLLASEENITLTYNAAAGRSEIIKIRVNKRIHILAREAESYERDAEDSE